MKPIFDRRSDLVGWFDGENVFDLKLNWIAFLCGGHFYSASNFSWLGPLHKGSLLDRGGKPAAWIAGASAVGTPKPLTPHGAQKPPQPLKPLQPLEPPQPLIQPVPQGGWSPLSWRQWRR